jgi:hypothetical protein
MSTFQLDPNQVAFGVPDMGTTQVFSVTNSSVQSTAFGASTTMVRLSCSLGHCHFQIGTNPTASVTTSPMMPHHFSEIIAQSNATPGFLARSTVAAGVAPLGFFCAPLAQTEAGVGAGAESLRARLAKDLLKLRLVSVLALSTFEPEWLRTCSS